MFIMFSYHAYSTIRTFSKTLGMVGQLPGSAEYTAGGTATDPAPAQSLMPNPLLPPRNPCCQIFCYAQIVNAIATWQNSADPDLMVNTTINLPPEDVLDGVSEALRCIDMHDMCTDTCMDMCRDMCPGM